MWPTIRDGFKAFLNDKAFFSAQWDKWVAKVRGFLLAAGVAATVYADKLEAAAPPSLQGKVKIGGVILAGIAVMLRAGDKTPENVKALSEQMASAKSPAP